MYEGPIRHFNLFQVLTVKGYVRSAGYAKKMIHLGKVYVNGEKELDAYRKVHITKDVVQLKLKEG